MLLLRIIANWFEPVRPSQHYGRQHYMVLLAILIVGTWLRFWHLGNVGLHGDEDIMALAARGILTHGIPILPSEMVYFRAPLHTYLLAGSTLIFGDTEWALRLPSAVVGSLCGILAFFMGMRFLDPKPNLCFVALITFLPAMIEISQTARMYVFFIASLLAFGILLFRWEKTGTMLSFLSAFIVLLIAIQFHRLAVFAAILLLYPGLANRSWKQMAQGVIALGAAPVISQLVGIFSNLDSPGESQRLAIETETREPPFDILFGGNYLLVFGIAVAVAIAVVAICTIGLKYRKDLLPATFLLVVGAVSCALLHYHIGVIALLLGVIGWVRVGTRQNVRLLVIGAAVGLVAIAQYLILQGIGEFPGRAIVGAFVGIPSIWPVLVFMTFSPVAAAVLIAAVGMAAYRFARGHAVPIYFLFFTLGVWIPLVAIGLFTWYPATRYTIGPLPFFLLVSICSTAYLIRGTETIARLAQRPVFAAVAAIILIAAIVNPALAWQTAMNSYAMQPDHKGAAEFVKKQHPAMSSVIIAEDSIVQFYYLGKIDYRLQNVLGAASHGLMKDGVLRDQYTAAPVIGSGAEFEVILERYADRDVYVIGSAQGSENLIRRNRGNGIAEVLASDRLEVVYVGRDGATMVWKLRH